MELRFQGMPEGLHNLEGNQYKGKYKRFSQKLIGTKSKEVFSGEDAEDFQWVVLDNLFKFRAMEAETGKDPLHIRVGNYTSSSAQETETSIKNQKVKNGRNLLRLEFIKKRKDFEQVVKFTETDSDKNVQFIAFKDDQLGLRQTKVLEIGLQGSQPYTETGAQTFFKRKVNKCLQINETKGEPESLKIKDDDLAHFLDNVYPEMEAALQSNETIDIFQNDFDVLPEEAGSKETTELSNTIKETKNLFYLKSKGKKVSSIQFQPWLQGRKNPPIIAESFLENLAYHQRVIFSMKSSKSFILFWNYEDMHAIDPLLILSSPLEITTFEFNPKDPSIIVAGTINGQILLWDLKNVHLGQTDKKKNRKSDKNQVREVAPSLMSALQDPSNIIPVSDQIKRNVPSHKTPVVCLKWFPSTLEIEMKKSYSALIQSPGPEINQFATISTDGQVLLWQKKFMDNQKKIITDYSVVNWKAGYGFHLFRPEGGGAMGGSAIAFNRNEKRTVFTGTSDQGELFVCDWSARSADEAGSKNDTITAYWNQQRCFRPVVSLDLLPSNENIILTVYDFHFCIWKTNIDVNSGITQVPLFSSLVSKGCFHTAGCWSPSRAGVCFIAKSNGTIDIWDFMDQSHKWTMQYSVGSTGISSMKFHHSNQNILAVGSQEGTLHILQLPFTLVRKIGDEDKTMNEYWEREIESVRYFSRRFEKRFEENQELRAKMDLEEKLRMQREEKKDKKEDQIRQINQEYSAYTESFLNSVEPKGHPEKVEEPKTKK